MSGWSAVTLGRPIQPGCLATAAGCPGRWTVTLSGGAYGVMITMDPAAATPATPDLPFGLVVKLPKEEGGRLAAVVGGRDPRTDVSSFDTSRLPAGRYRVYLLTKGPGAATLVMASQPLGTRRLSAANRAHVEVSQQAPDMLAGLAPSSWAAGLTVSDVQMPFYAFAFDWQGSVGDVSAVGSAGMCLYDGPPPLDRWLPQCVGGQAIGMNYLTPIKCCGTGYGYVSAKRGGFSIGSYYTHGAAVNRAGGLYLAVGLR